MNILLVPWLSTAWLGSLVSPDATAVDSRGYRGPTGVAHETTAQAPATESSKAAPEPTVDDDRRRRVQASSWTFGGFVDVAYLFNHNRPDNHVYRGTNTTPRTNEVTLNSLTAYVTHEPTASLPMRLELGFQAGAAVEALMAPEPVPGGDDGRFAGAEVWKHVALANVGGVTPWGMEIGAGLFQSPIGIGGFWAKDNWNYSPSWESNAAPFYLFGLRIVQPLPAGIRLEGWVVNGWQTISDANRVPSYHVAITRSGPGGLQVSQQVYFGPESEDISAEAWRVHTDTWLVFDRPRYGVGVVWDFGRERMTRIAGRPVALWTGGGLFLRWLVLEGRRFAWDMSARPDAFWDPDGTLFGADQWLISGTYSNTLRLFDALQVRLDYRYDLSTARLGYFYRRSATTDDSIDLAPDQHTVFLALIGHFDLALPQLRRRR